MGRWIEDENGVLNWHPKIKFYERENKIFSEADDKKLNKEEMKIVFKKLKRHFRKKVINSLRIEFNSNWNGHFRGGVFCNYYIDMPKQSSFRLLCHEFAHAIDYQKRGKSKHDKKLMRVIKRVIRYCEKKNWWEEELKKRTK